MLNNKLSHADFVSFGMHTTLPFLENINNIYVASSVPHLKIPRDKNVDIILYTTFQK